MWAVKIPLCEHSLMKPAMQQHDALVRGDKLLSCNTTAGDIGAMPVPCDST